jgi:2-dehydropantoate 2-reductase
MNPSMRTLVVGAGAIGGYFGGRLLEAGRDVTFLVRPRRAEELADSGLRIRSRFGDVTILKPPMTLAENLRSTFDLVLLSCKAYDLAGAMVSFAPALGPETAILPLLNGMRHLKVLADRFGPDVVLGGQCLIAATLNEKRDIVHLNDSHAVSFGERNGALSDRVLAIDSLMDGARFEHRASPNIVLEMWEKWVFLATLAGSTCLLRATIGDISAAPGGSDLVLGIFEECQSIATAEGYPPRASFVEPTRAILTTKGSALTASMLRDIEAGAPIEADHIIGDLLARGASSLLSIVYSSLKAYEARRSRTLAARTQQRA